MSFSAGFARGFSAVDQMKRTQLAEKQTAERNRQWEVTNKRVQDEYDREVNRERMTDLSKRYNTLRDDLLADPDFQREDGSFDEEKAMSHPAVLGMMSELARDNDALGRALRKGQNHNGEMDGIEFVPAGAGRVAATMNVKDAEGNVQTRPITTNRSSDPNDTVETFSFGDFDRIMSDSLAPYQEAPTTLRGREAELNVYEGGDPALSTSPSAPAPSPEPVAAPPQGGAVASPATPLQPAPEGTPYSSAGEHRTESEVPSAEPASLREQEIAQREEGGLGAVFSRIGDYYKDAQTKGRVRELQEMLDVDNPRGAARRLNPKLASKTYTEVHDQLNPEDRAAVLEHVREPLLQRKEELEKKAQIRPSGKPASIHHKRIQAEINKINAALDPATQEQPPAPEVTVGAVATPAKVEAMAETMAEPTVAETTVAVDEVARPTKRSVRSGKPSRAQLLAAMRLQKRGALTPAQVARYARTGQLTDDEGGAGWQIMNLGEGVVAAINKDTHQVKPLIGELPDGTPSKMSLKQLDSNMKRNDKYLDGLFVTTGKSAAIGKAQRGEFREALRRDLGLSDEGYAMLDTGKLNSLHQDWLFVKNRNAQKGLFGGRKHKEATLADMQVHVNPAVKQLLVRDGRITEKELETMTPKEIDNVGKAYLAELEGTAGGSQKGTRPF